MRATFRGKRLLRGGGLGNSLGRFFRRIFLPAAKAVGTEILNQGREAIDDIATGKDPKSVIKSKLKKAGANLAVKTGERVAQKILTGKGKSKTKTTTSKRSGRVVKAQKKNCCKKRRYKDKADLLF